MRSLLLLGVLLSCTPALQGTEVFRDGFEEATLSGQWTVDTTNTGRVAIDSQYEPAAGQHHLILDDSVSDTGSSAAEAILQLDLANKRNIVLSFRAKSIGNEPDAPPTGDPLVTRAFDGISISLDQGATWHLVRSLAALSTTWESVMIGLDAAIVPFGAFGPDFRIRFSGYDNAPAPVDGIAIDEVVVTADEDQRAVLELPPQLVEGSHPNTGYVALSIAPTSALTLELTASVPGQLELPATLTVPAGETVASFSFSVLDDLLVNLRRTVTLHATSPGVASTPGTITILDNETAVGAFDLPALLTEGSPTSGTAVLTLDPAPSVPVPVTLVAAPAGEITIPPTITVPAGQQAVVFAVGATNDAKLDGDVIVTVTATADPMAPVTVTTTAVDNETRALTLTTPGSLLEGATGAATLRISGTLPTDLVVTLSGTEGEIATPASVTMIAGRTQMSFAVTAVENTRHDGTRIAAVAASAPTFVPITREITIRDNDVATYRFDPLGDIVEVSSPVAVTLSALDVEGNALTGFAGSVNLSVVLPDGTTQAPTPATATLAQGKWTGPVTLPAVTSTPMRLHATDPAGTRGETNFFDIMRTLRLVPSDLVWDGLRNRVCAGVLPVVGATYANRVVAIDPSSLQIVASSPVLAKPGHLALTSGGEFLYAALDGNGTVAKLDGATLAVISTFELGTDPLLGRLFAGDLCTVPGQPGVLVVSQAVFQADSGHNGVAAYDEGVVRSKKSPGTGAFTVIEPSADPRIFFGYSRAERESTFRRFRLDAEGIVQTDAVPAAVGQSDRDLRSAGDLVIFPSGVAVDVSRLQRVGSFGTDAGFVCPDPPMNRVYFLERNPQFLSYDSLAAFDLADRSVACRLALPSLVGLVSSPIGFVRWSSDGLAFGTYGSLVFINSSRLVPSGAPADLATTVEASPVPNPSAMPLTYTVRVTNHGPNPARWVSVRTSLTNDTIHEAVANSGSTSVAGSIIEWQLPDLAVHASATLTINTPTASKLVTNCTAMATSGSIDPKTGNNRALRLVSPAFQPVANSASTFPFSLGNLIYDAKRHLLWATTAGIYLDPLRPSLVAVDPADWSLSDPVELEGYAAPNVIALSRDGRYLYLGLNGVPGVARVDLEAIPPKPVSVHLGPDGFGRLLSAEDIEVLDGDGTSFLIAGSDDQAVVFDGSVPRPVRASSQPVDRLEPTADPGRFVSFGSNQWLRRLTVDSTGVTVSEAAFDRYDGYGLPDISGGGNQVLTSTGVLVDTSMLSKIFELGEVGRPCLDPANQRAYMVSANRLHGFDTTTGARVGGLQLPVAETGNWAKACVRWGLDGFAILGRQTPPSGPIIVRWSEAVRDGADLNANGVPDAWEAANLGPLGGRPEADLDGDGIANALEYLFGTSPTQAAAHPLQMSLSGNGALRLVFPRRAGLPPGFYGFESSPDLQLWSPAAGVVETVVRTQTIDGVEMETVEALIPLPDPGSAFVHLRWPKR